MCSERGIEVLFHAKLKSNKEKIVDFTFWKGYRFRNVP